MDGLDETLALKERLYVRLKETRKIAQETTDPARRREHLERAKVLGDMYRDVCAEVRRRQGKPEAEKRKTVANAEKVFRTGLVWSDMRGNTWQMAKDDHILWGELLEAREPGAATGRQYTLLTRMLNDGLAACTEKQRTCLGEYYGEELTTPEIGARHGVNKSTVSRLIRAGLTRVGHSVMARLTIAPCIQDGKFDYLKFCRTTSALTERQTELVYLALTQDSSYTMMAAYLGRAVSTVSRGIDRAERRLSAMRVDLLPQFDTSGIRFRDWAGIEEVELARRLGLNRKFFYSVLHRGEQIDGLPLLHYHALCRMREGWPPRNTAEELGCSARFCAELRRRYERFPGPMDMGRLPAYSPAPRGSTVEKGTVLRALRDLTRGDLSSQGEFIIDRIDGATMARLREQKLC